MKATASRSRMQQVTEESHLSEGRANGSCLSAVPPETGKTHTNVLANSIPTQCRSDSNDGRGGGNNGSWFEQMCQKGRESKGSELPPFLRTRVEAASGMSLRDIRVHYNSEIPEAIGAMAFARGSEIHVGRGEEKHLPHEAWHIVQQRRGEVQPNRLIGGFGVNDDVRLEVEAEAMGSQLARGGRVDDPQSGETRSSISKGSPAPVAQFTRKKGADPSLKEIINQTIDSLRNDGVVELQDAPEPLGGGTASEVFKARLPGPLVEGGTSTAYAKKGLRAIRPEDKTEELWDSVSGLAESDDPEGVNLSKEAAAKIVNAFFDNRKKGNLSGMVGGATTINLGIKGVDMLNTVAKAFDDDPVSYKEAKGNMDENSPPHLLLDDPQLNARAVMSSRIDKLLGTNVLSDEAFGRHLGEVYGLSLEVPGGRSLKEKEGEVSVLKKLDWSNPTIQKGMSDLTLLDALTGQQDRHNGNIFVTPENLVKGIDNDMSFSPEAALPSLKDLDKRFVWKKNGTLKYFQEVMDYGTAKRILALKEEDLRGVLAGNDGDPERLGGKEIKNTLIRFRAIQNQARKLKKKGKLIKNWDDNSYNKMMGEKADSSFAPNYLARSVRDYNKAADYGTEGARHWKEKEVPEKQIVNQTGWMTVRPPDKSIHPHVVASHFLGTRIPAEQIRKATVKNKEWRKGINFEAEFMDKFLNDGVLEDMPSDATEREISPREGMRLDWEGFEMFSNEESSEVTRALPTVLRKPRPKGIRM